MEGLNDFGALEGGGATSGADCAERWRVVGEGVGREEKFYDRLYVVGV